MVFVIFAINIGNNGACYATTPAPNLLYNSSFEITTNPDIPDGWSRDYALPPWGPGIYSIDSKISFHGKNSLRLGYKGKYARSWNRHTKILKGKDYSFSVYLKSNRKGVQAFLNVNSIASKKITVNPEWTRFNVSGVAKSETTFVEIHLQSEGVLWIDAAQLEEGKIVGKYALSKEDGIDYESYLNRVYKDLYKFTQSRTQCRIKENALRDKELNPVLSITTEYNFYTRENTVKIRCVVNNTPKEQPLNDFFWRLEKDSKIIKLPEKINFKPGKNEWEFDISNLDYGDYTIAVEYKPVGHSVIQKQTTFKKLVPQQHEVKINQWGRFIVADEQPLFFYGFYDNLSKGKKERWPIALDEMKAVGANGVINYIGGTLEYDVLGWALDEAHNKGQKLWVHLGWFLSYNLPKYENRPDKFDSEEEALSRLKEIVVKYKQHPALLGWATLDEPDNRPHIFTKEVVEKYYRLIKDLDPYHPCIISHLSILGQSGCYGNATDIAVIPYSSRQYYDDLFDEYWNLGLPVYTNSNCIGAIGRDRREPTPEEQSVKLFKAVLRGARGLCTYTFRCNSMGTWKEFGIFSEKLNFITPVLWDTSDSMNLINTNSKETNVLALLKVHNDDVYIMAVNEGRSAENVSLNLSGIQAEILSVKRINDVPSANYDAESKVLNFNIPSLGIAIYQLNTKR